jgi:hypothetical protein
MKSFRDALITAAVVALALLTLEGGLRVAQVRFNARLYQPDADRGFGLRPHAEGWNVGEGEAYVRINSDGLRDVERPIARPAGTLRIAVVGSCEAEARQVALEQTFEVVMKRELEQALRVRGGSVDVLNFGVPGYTFSQEYVTFRDHALKYDPQVVILLLQPLNYIKNTRELYPGDSHQTPFYELQNGRLVPDAITRSTAPPDAKSVALHNGSADLLNRSHLIGLANAARMELMRQVSGWKEQLKPGRAVHAAAPVREDFEYLRYVPEHPETQKSWAIGEAFVEEMRAECARRGIEFRIVTVDANMATHPDPAARARFLREMHISSIDATEHRIQSFCSARGIPLQLTARPLLAYAEANRTFLHGDPVAADNMGFWNVRGHQVVGSLMARDLLDSSPAVASWRPR